MPNKRISELELVTDLSLSDSLPIVSGGKTKKTTVGNLALSGFFPSSSITSSYSLNANSASYASSSTYSQFSTDLYLTVKNVSGNEISKGKLVKISGANGDNALISTASWQNDENSAETIGWTYENIPNDSFGRVILYGTLFGINTNAFSGGDVLYLSASGEYTNVKPTAPYHTVVVGQVLRVQQTNGSVSVKIQNGWELDELHNVKINTGSLADNNLLVVSSSLWVNKTPSQIGLVTTSSFVVPNFNGAPSSPTSGTLYFNTTDFHFYGWNGNQWKQLDN